MNDREYQAQKLLFLAFKIQGYIAFDHSLISFFRIVIECNGSTFEG